MGAASIYLSELGRAVLDSKELDRFLSHVAVEPDKDEKQRDMDHLLRVVDLSPDQVVLVAASAPVRETIGLQLSVKRYATTKQFEAAQRCAQNEPAWKKALLSLGMALPPC